MWDINDAALDNEREMVDAIVRQDVASDECDRCGKRRELFHNERTGLALCEACDRITDEVEELLDPAPVTMPVTWKRLRNGAWGVTGPADLLVSGAQVVVTKRDGTTKLARIGRVLWSGTNREGEPVAIATTRRA